MGVERGAGPTDVEVEVKYADENDEIHRTAPTTNHHTPIKNCLAQNVNSAAVEKSYTIVDPQAQEMAQKKYGDSELGQKKKFLSLNWRGCVLLAESPRE